MTVLSQAAALAWIDRWDRQQEDYLPDREDRFTVLIDAVEASAGQPDPVVLDLGCGPGSLSVRLLDRMPAATVIAVDTDPVLLALGCAAYRGKPGLRFADVDLSARDWSASLGLTRQADAAASTTALHWLEPPDLAAMYRELATVLKPGGLLLNGDHLRLDPAVSPVLARLDQLLLEREELRRFPDGHAESWGGWWQAAIAAPELAGPVAERERRHGDHAHHGSAAGLLATHVQALRAAGFAEVGTLWQRGENRLLCAVRSS